MYLQIVHCGLFNACSKENYMHAYMLSSIDGDITERKPGNVLKWYLVTL